MRLASAKVRAGGDQHVVHVKAAERGVGSLACSSLSIGVDHSRNPELIFRIVPAKRHHGIGSVIRLRPINLRLLQRERPFHRFFRENYAGTIGLLQKLNETMNQLLIMPDNIEKNAPAVAG